LLSLSPSPAVGPCGIPTDPGADDVGAGVGAATAEVGACVGAGAVEVGACVGAGAVEVGACVGAGAVEVGACVGAPVGVEELEEPDPQPATARQARTSPQLARNLIDPVMAVPISMLQFCRG
jgi:hypothetical protein